METGYVLTGLAICSSVVLSVVTILHRSLLALLGDLCAGREGARFWTLALELCFVLYSISSALTWGPEGTSDRQLLQAGINQVKNGLSAASSAFILLSLGLAAVVSIRKLAGSINHMLRRKSA